jgi:putative ABC transport system ATP-binding protein
MESARSMASILIRQGQQILREVPLYKSSLDIGRSSDCEIQLVDRGVSRRHAQITRADGLYYVEDLGGKSGVTLNSLRVKREQLNHRDRILIPPFQLEFLADEQAGAEPAETVVDVAGVSKQYILGKQTVTALQDITMTVSKGEFMALAGPSGSGKSTLLNLIGCIDTPSSGSIRIMGQDVGGKSPDDLADLRLHTLGFVFQTFNLLPVLSAWENVEYPLLQQRGLSKQTRQERVAHYLKVVGLEQHVRHRPNELSGGQRQRVAIARALATHPGIVLADEPTANLDHKTGEGILQLMKALNQQEGTTFIFSTHDRRVMEMADRVIELADGRMTE